MIIGIKTFEIFKNLAEILSIPTDFLTSSLAMILDIDSSEESGIEKCSEVKGDKSSNIICLSNFTDKSRGFETKNSLILFKSRIFCRFFEVFLVSIKSEIVFHNCLELSFDSLTFFQSNSFLLYLIQY